MNRVGNMNFSVLRFAILQDNITCADLLIKAGANVNGGYYTPLYYAVTQKANQCVDLLLKSGANVNSKSSCKAFIHVEDVNCCRLLLKHHSQINRRDRCYGQNALTRHIGNANPVNKDLCALLFAAGETVPQTITRWSPPCKEINVIDYLPQIQIYFYLTELCREAIRRHLLKLDQHTNLFDRIPRLELPKPLIKFYMTLDSSSPPSNETK